MPDYLNQTQYTFYGLAENTLYYFQVKAGDALAYDTSPFLPAPNATTLISGTARARARAPEGNGPRYVMMRRSLHLGPPLSPPPPMCALPAPIFNVANTVVTTDSIKISWSPGSSLTRSYLVYGKRTINSRDLPASTYQLLQNSTATTCQVLNLASGSFYTFRVHAITATGVDGNQAEFTFQTTAAAGQEGTLPPGGMRTRNWARGVEPDVGGLGDQARGSGIGVRITARVPGSGLGPSAEFRGLARVLGLGLGACAGFGARPVSWAWGSICQSAGFVTGPVGWICSGFRGSARVPRLGFGPWAFFCLGL